jgi:phage tail sheath gpL-like
MSIVTGSLAAGVGVTAQNIALVQAIQDVDRKLLIIGSYDPLKTLVVPDVPQLMLSAQEVGADFGFGSMVHRLAMAAERGTGGNVNLYVSPQAEAGGAAAAAGELTFTGPSTAAGTIYLYIAGDQVQVNIAKGATLEEIADAVVAAIAADSNLPVTAAKVAVTFEVTITAKTKGTYGNEISLAANLNTGEELPAGVTFAVSTAMTGGTGTPTISTALDALGTGDNANEDYYTAMVHGYLQDTTTLDAISTYVGEGNLSAGLWKDTIGRPFQSLTGDVDPGSAALTALIALGDGRKNDRANGIVAVPDSESHPSEIAAIEIGIRESVAKESAAKTPLGRVLPGVWPGDKGADRWTSDYTSRDLAVKAGISPTLVDSNAVKVQNIISFYHPDSVADANNGYRDFADLSKLQNILFNTRLVLEQERLQGAIIVADISKADPSTRSLAVDVETLKDYLVIMLEAFEARGWIYSAASSIALFDASTVTVRAGGTGFDVILPLFLSGNAEIFTAKLQFDTNIA